MTDLKKSYISYFALLFLFYSNFLLSNNYLNWDRYKNEVLRTMPEFSGWCSKEKGELLMDFIYEMKPTTCVEIGAFGGSTTFPLASAIRFNSFGKLYSIDAWNIHAAIAGLDSGDPNSIWWSTLDMGAIHNQFIAKLAEKNLNRWCSPVHMLSEKAVSLFADESIDLLYIDGNFSSQGSFQDAVLYFPKVKLGGYIWLNDAHSPAKLDAIIFLMENCTWLPEKSLENQCIVFRKH